MTHEEALIAIQGQFETEWNSATPVAWPNVAFTPPTIDPEQPTDGWVRFAVVHAEAIAAGMGGSGNRLNRYPGVVIIQVFTPAGVGVGPGLGLAEDAAAVFERWSTADSTGSVQFGVPTIRHVGDSGDGWDQHNVECPFRHDRTAA